MQLMQQTTITNTLTGITKTADVLSKSARRLKVVIEGTTMSVTMTKNTPSEATYVGHAANMEFTSTGK